MNREVAWMQAMVLLAAIIVVVFMMRPMKRPAVVTEATVVAAGSSQATLRAGRWIATRVSTVDDAVKLLQSIEPLTAARAKVFGSGAYIWVIYEDDVLQRRQRAPQK